MTSEAYPLGQVCVWRDKSHLQYFYMAKHIEKIFIIFGMYRNILVLLRFIQKVYSNFMLKSCLWIFKLYYLSFSNTYQNKTLISCIDKETVAVPGRFKKKGWGTFSIDVFGPYKVNNVHVT